MSALVLAFMWVLRFLPARLVAAVGNAIGTVFFWAIPERRKVTRINLEKCFPSMSAHERENLARAHFRAFCRAFVERGILWWSSAERIRRLVRLEGLEHLPKGGPVIVLAPHFVGLDAALARLSLERPLAVTYSRQKDARVDRVLVRGRGRFGARLLARQAGVRPALRAIAAGEAYYYLPDLDFGSRGALFVPFFGVPAATVTGLSYISHKTAARVVPCVTRMLATGGYVVRLYPAWSGFPSGDDAVDARRMNAFIEEHVLEMPEQYHWLHKRFKTRPPGEARFY